MDLVEAFETAFHGLNSREGLARAPAAHSGEATALIYEKLGKLAERDLRYLQPADREDAAAETMAKLLQARPRLRKENPTDATVGAFLAKALQHNASNLMRRGRRYRALDETHTAPSPAAEELPDSPAPHLERLAALNDEFAATLRRADASESQRTSLGEIVALYMGDSRIEDLLGLQPGEPSFRQRRDALYQRHLRCRQKLHECLVHRMADGSLEGVEGARLVRLLDGLRRRADES